MTSRVDVTQAIDASKVNGFHWSIFLLCGICLIMDGFDVQAIGYVAPALIQDWHLANAQMGPVLTAALVGVLIGSLSCSMLADKIGRRPVIVAATLFFSVMTFFTARATSLNELMWLRLVAGIGLGAIMPNAVALSGEFSSKSARVAVMMIVANGFTAGAAIGGFIAAWMIPNFGWRSVFYFGAFVPLAIGIAMWLLLPESLQFLAVKGRDKERIRTTLAKLDPSRNDAPGTEYFVAEQTQRGVPIFHLFHEGRALATLMLWTINFMNLLNLYFLSSWLPTVVRDLGYTARTGVLVGTTLQVGGTIGALCLPFFVKRIGMVPVLATGFALAALNISFIGVPGLALATLVTVVFIAGVGVVGGQAGINALAATIYPTELRSTGVGSGLGVGRLGAIVGPIIGGQMMAAKFGNRELFLAAAIPAAISMMAMIAMRWILKPAARTAEPAAISH